MKGIVLLMLVAKNKLRDDAFSSAPRTKNSTCGMKQAIAGCGRCGAKKPISNGCVLTVTNCLRKRCSEFAMASEFTLLRTKNVNGSRLNSRNEWRSMSFTIWYTITLTVRLPRRRQASKFGGGFTQLTQMRFQT